jgi:hypothetical protein
MQKELIGCVSKSLQHVHLDKNFHRFLQRLKSDIFLDMNWITDIMGVLFPLKLKQTVNVLGFPVILLPMNNKI